MRKIIFLIIISFITSTTFAQQGKKVKIIRSELLKGFTKEGVMRLIKPVFEQEESTLSADSANFNQDKNTFDAFGHVIITQSNGIVVYADLLNFDGNTRMALLTNNVRLVDKDKATLSTNYLTYNTGTKIGTYTSGGKIVDPQNVLTSVTGYYYANTHDAYFKNNVVLTSTDVVIKSDTLRYNSASKIAYFYGPTHIYGKEDTLYTENGQYNTTNDQALFGKNNLYTQGSKSLKGDSLFFDQKLGYGRAIKNITFTDDAEKITFKGDLGIYHKKDESILATKNAYIVMHTETDSSKIDSIWMAADTLFSKVVRGHEVKSIRKNELKKDNDLGDVIGTQASDHDKENKALNKSSDSTFIKDTPVSKKNQPNRVDSVLAKGVTSTLRSKSPDASEKPPSIDHAEKKEDTTHQSSIAPSEPKEKNPKLTQNRAIKDLENNQSQNSLMCDTAKVRIVFAYHKAKIFKSDLQAIADSIFFSYKDSTIRCYVRPMIWSQGYQFSADTIYLQMKNKKLNNMLLQHNGFIVGTEAIDSSKFNQVKGKVITGYFRKNKLSNMFVDGNAESIYYVKEGTHYSGMNRMLSSRMKVLFDNHTLKDILFIRKPEGTYYPIHQTSNDESILPGFVWKPKDRPKSKEEIIPSLAESKEKIRIKKPTTVVPKSKTKPIKRKN